MSDRMILRQGDVMLVSVASLPAGATRTTKPGERVVLAWGERTGHCHEVLADSEAVDAFLSELAGVRYLTAPATSTRVVHEEHGTIPIPEGIFQVVAPFEWADSLEPRQVLD